MAYHSNSLASSDVKSSSCLRSSSPRLTCATCSSSASVCVCVWLCARMYVCTHICACLSSCVEPDVSLLTTKTTHGPRQRQGFLARCKFHTVAAANANHKGPNRVRSRAPAVASSHPGLKLNRNLQPNPPPPPPGFYWILRMKNGFHGEHGRDFS